MKSAFFLGYPLKDVKCFISYVVEDTECAESGRLPDVVNAQRSFLCYKHVVNLSTQLMLGKTFSSLVARTA